MNNHFSRWPLVLNGVGLWAVALAILWSSYQPHTVLLAGADPRVFKFPVPSNASVTVDGTLDLTSSGLTIDPSGGTLDVDMGTRGTIDLNLGTGLGGIDVNTSQK